MPGHIWLIGMMGSGKSAVGRALARRLDRTHYDTDDEVVVRDLDMDLITEVRRHWAFYRDRRTDSYEVLTG